MKFRTISWGVIGAASLLLATAAQATTILSFDSENSLTGAPLPNTSVLDFNKITNTLSTAKGNDPQLVTIGALSGTPAIFTLSVVGNHDAQSTTVPFVGNLLTETFGSKTDQGSFSYTSVATGKVLLAGTFYGALISGYGGGVSGNLSNDYLTGGTITSLTTTVPGVNLGNLSTDAFVFSLGQIAPNLAISGNSLKGFDSFATGSFSSAVPEPASWGLMFLGFGAIGAMMRSARRKNAVTA
jgi:hypothetical protein